MKSDKEGCVCKGNWRILVAEYHHLIGRKYRSTRGSEYIFFGLVHSYDDYYYGLSDTKNKVILVSCCGDLEKMGYKLVPLNDKES